MGKDEAACQTLAKVTNNYGYSARYAEALVGFADCSLVQSRWADASKQYRLALEVPPISDWNAERHQRRATPLIEPPRVLMTLGYLRWRVDGDIASARKAFDDALAGVGDNADSRSTWVREQARAGLAALARLPQ